MHAIIYKVTYLYICHFSSCKHHGKVWIINNLCKHCSVYRLNKIKLVDAHDCIFIIERPNNQANEESLSLSMSKT